MPIRVRLPQENREVVLEADSMTVSELLRELKLNESEATVILNGFPVKNPRTVINVNDRVEVIKHSPRGRCSICGREAYARIPYAKLTLCREHFIEFIAKRVRRTIEEYRLVRRGDLVLVAVSGGKDSSTMLHVLSTLRDSLKFEIVAYHIDQGIPGYSDKARLAVEELAKRLNVPLIVSTFREMLGVDQPALIRGMKSRRPPCSVCGIVRRYSYNALAIELKASSIATGHHADDVASYALKAILTHDYQSLAKLTPRTEPFEGAVAHIRPLYEVYERETLLYAIASEIPFTACPCPFRPRNTLDDHIKELLNNLEARHPGIKLSFLRGLAREAKALGKVIEEGAEAHTCKVCGLASSGDVCSFCKFTQHELGSAMGPHVREILRVKVSGLGLK